MASDGGQVRQLTFDPDGENIPSWSQDGNWIYFASKRTGRFEIWKVSVKGGKDIQVTRHGGWVALESYDGRFLYYTKNIDDQEYLSGLWALPLAGGDERLVLKSIGYRAFAVRRDGIYYISSPTANGSASVRFYDFATGKSREITSFKENFAGGLTVSPDRKTILFSVFARTGSNVMIVDNFR
jgi:Tol biopolymer transport system component